jgi:hypothetical protein
MRAILSVGLFFALVILASAITTKGKESPDPSAKQTCQPPGWKGVILLRRKPGHEVYYLPESSILMQGYATVQQEFTDDYRYWTAIMLDIPCGKNIEADNLKLEWYAKSDLELGIWESDLGASLVCEADTVIISGIPNRPEYNQMRFGKTNIKNFTEIYPTPQSWTKYTIDIKEKKMRFCKNDKVLKEIGNSQPLGLLRKLNIHFKAKGKIDWVKLYQGKNLVMEDNFDKEGVSTLRWLR